MDEWILVLFPPLASITDYFVESTLFSMAAMIKHSLQTQNCNFYNFQATIWYDSTVAKAKKKSVSNFGIEGNRQCLLAQLRL